MRIQITLLSCFALLCGANSLAANESVIAQYLGGKSDKGVSDCKGDIDAKGIIDCCCEPLWTVNAGLVYMKRESPSIAQEFDFDFETGVEVGIKRRLRNNNSIELRYIGVDSWQDSYDNSIPMSVTDFGSYLSRLHSTEINLRHRYTDRFEVLGGFRWVELHEEANATYVDPFNPPPTIQNVNADNHMYGFQLGVEAMLVDRSCFQVTTGIKAGAYYNVADMDQFVTGVTTSREDTNTAFLGEFDLTARYQLTKCLALRASYELIWVEGVVTADTAATFLPNGDFDGSPFYHGGIIGLEFAR